ncbi:MAG: hypothetical protein C4524_09705 [Candidatus Zixiibacteriota bacterium]|nr:MAG: hypothetical protein C4524_09705 [candidate division Zixibacteria bacterium]
MGKRYRNPEPGLAFFVTTTAKDFMQICCNEACYQVITEAIRLNLLTYSMKLLGYVLMPNHVHLVLLGDGEKISSFMRDFKRAAAVRLRQEWDRAFPELKHRFKSPRGGGYKIWMDRFYLVVVYSESVLKTKLKYMLLNPVRKELVQSMFEWPHSSAVNYANPDRAILPIEFIHLDLE